MSIQWDRKTSFVLFLEVWLGSSLVVLGFEAAHSLEILIMSSFLNLMKSCLERERRYSEESWNVVSFFLVDIQLMNIVILCMMKQFSPQFCPFTM